MTDNTTIILALISLVGTIVTASITAYVLIKVGHVETKVGHVETRTVDLAKSVDGQMTKLLEASIGKATAEGVTAGEQAQRDRSAPAEATPVIIANPPDKPVPVDPVTKP